MGISTLPAKSLGVDYSFARPSASTLRSAGVSFVSRYLADGSKKVIDGAERDDLFAAGLALLLNWEQSSGDFLVPSKGAPQGTSAARQAAALGYPSELPIIVSCDSEASPDQYDAVVAYFTAFKEAAGWELGVYAQSEVANRLLAEGLVSFVWAPNAKSWNRGVAYDRIDIQQFFGESEFPALARFGDQIDPDRAEQAIPVWTAGADEPADDGSGDGPGTGSDHAAADQPATDQPATAQPAADQPATDQPATAQPAADQPATDQPAAATTYTVRPGDSWWAIARSQLGSGTKDTELATFNGKTIDDTIFPGDVLRIPPS